MSVVYNRYARAFAEVLQEKQVDFTQAVEELRAVAEERTAVQPVEKPLHNGIGQQRQVLHRGQHAGIQGQGGGHGDSWIRREV